MWWNFDAAPTFAPLAMILGAAFGYLLGSIPFGLVFTRMAGLGDIRAIGSGNIGATNVLRTGNKPLALATLLADGGKGALAVLIAGMLGGPMPSVAAGVAAFAGHVYPVWLNFKGGKGVATYFGILIAFAWPIGLAAGASWIALAFMFRYSSLAALGSALLAPIFFVIGGLTWLAIPIALCSALIYWRHRSNIARLLSGSEPRIGEKADPAAAKP
ncbi:MAG TPA: glycerol-3-phosphate 1-O-acyltransferase PlsY [Alphaproteobacteria bacterium]|nr:glycerol-3-phosphate 1-O-acyltransferase PlsY [Alphaproteobacteria bacterium]